jgi:flagellar hook-associated protein 2
VQLPHLRIEKGGATAGTEITISPDNDSLEGLRDAINAADAGVTAAIVDISGNGSQYQLVLSSKKIREQ